MEIFEVSSKEYFEVITPYHIFGSSAFNELNKFKCDKVYYLVFKEGKYRLGIIGGARENSFYSPFSAPFGGFSSISSAIRIQYLEGAIESLKIWAAEKNIHSIIMTLPPAIYNSSFIAKQINCLWREGFEISQTDLNYSFKLKYLEENYFGCIWHNARKNLKQSLKSGLSFHLCEDEIEKELTYKIISENRSSRGYPLRMTMEEVMETSEVIPANFFLVKNQMEKAIASAIVFHLSNSVVQVIYWGDLPGNSELKPMNFISFKVFEFYKLMGKEIVDIGPSTEKSIPNYGLCEFKEGIGCEIDPKFTFQFKLT